MRRILVVLLLGAIAGCSDAPGAPDGGSPPIDTGARCHADAECSDGTFCNGAERCVGDASGGDARGCAPAATASPCTGTQVCDETMDRCADACSDVDGDGHVGVACGGDDCDDTDAHRFPGNTEVCAYDATSMMRIDPAHDEDCNPMTYANGAAGDGDHDGDGFVDAACRNVDASGNVMRGGDCADLAAAMAMAPFTAPVPAANVHPTESETCNGVDDDCNGMVDDGLTTHTYYPDCDGDNFGDMHATGVMACRADAVPACNGHTAVMDARDCNDMVNLAHPGQPEICDGVDDDCNGTIDDATPSDAACRTMFPGTQHGTVACSATTHACALGCATDYADCDGLIGNGCEVDLRTDRAHCGTCTTACGLAATCNARACEGVGAIDGGASHTCALYATSGHAVCWGANGDGQLGDGTRVNRLVATPVAPPVGGAVQSFTYLSAGGLRVELDLGLHEEAHTCAGTGTSLYCWGRGVDGQLGNSSTGSVSAPVLVAALPMATAMSAGTPVLVGVTTGADYSVALQREPITPGTSVAYQQWAFGQNRSSAWGIASPALSVVPFATVRTTNALAAPTASVAAGASQTCWVSSLNQQLYCASAGIVGQVTLPAGWASVAEVDVNGLSGYGPQISMDTWSSRQFCARRSGASGPVFCQGSIQNGVVVGVSDATQIAVGARHACALRVGGTVVCWGDNMFGTLGVGTTWHYRDPPTPPDYSAMAVMGLTSVVRITAGAEHTCAVRTDGSVWCWGRNDRGQLGDGTIFDRPSPTRVLGL